MVEIINIFLTIIINKNLLISFIFSGPKNFAVEIKNYRIDYLQDNWRMKILYILIKFFLNQITWLNQ